jgi:hypothetical protein
VNSPAALWKCSSSWTRFTAESRQVLPQRQKSTTTISSARDLSEKEKSKPCCCNDPCESVETTPSCFSAFACSRHFPAPFCENSGKSGRLMGMLESFPRFIHFHQQIPRIFFNSSPQE